MSGIFSALLTVFGIMFLGLLAERRRILAPTMALCLNQFVYWVSLPALIFMQMCTIPMGGAQAFAWGTLAASLLCYAAAYLLFSRFWKRHDTVVTIRTLAAVFPNAAFFGLPFIFMVFPDNEEAVTAGMLGALLYTGVFLIADASLDMLSSEGRERKGLGRRLFKELTHNPMLVSALVGGLLGFFGVPVPRAVTGIAEMLGSTAAPCALFGMGMVLSAQLSGAGEVKGECSRRHLVVISISKLLLQPLFTFLVLALLGCTGTALAVGTVTAAMPTGTMVYILGERYRARPTEASMTVIVTTLLSLASLPLVMFALQKAGLV
ncbi:AEC family transporter [uncultured Mailhella sp.]|uniref:AEC family transporter n=1 Tax=uncultured Mailhella sp. TaxID=1981031 RepID=UPI0025EE755B|nr:AEC family transporter [uncultured Mailhella sp.]